jgi:hypothetical protein
MSIPCTPDPPTSPCLATPAQPDSLSTALMPPIPLEIPRPQLGNTIPHKTHSTSILRITTHMVPEVEAMRLLPKRLIMPNWVFLDLERRVGRRGIHIRQTSVPRLRVVFPRRMKFCAIVPLSSHLDLPHYDTVFLVPCTYCQHKSKISM